MGIISGITNKAKKVVKSTKKAVGTVAKSAKKTVKAASKPVADAVKGAQDVQKKAVKAVASGASQAAKGAANIGNIPVKAAKKVATTAVKTTAKVAKAAPKVAKTAAKVASNPVGAAAAGAAAIGKKVVSKGKEAVSSAANGVKELASKLPEPVKKAGKAAGKWAWDNKGEIALWVGTSALIAAVPLTGGASGAAAGGLLASRAGLIGARVAASGKVGKAAVSLAKIGAKAVQGGGAALKGTKAAAGLTKASNAVTAGRTALGATKVGKAMTAAQTPLTWAGNVAGATFFGETMYKGAKGEKSVKEMAIGTLGIVPLAGTGVKKLAALRAANADTKVAHIVANNISNVKNNASIATSKAFSTASAAPSADAPVTATRALAAKADSEKVVSVADEIVDRVVPVLGATKAKTKIANAAPAREIADRLGKVESLAGNARANAASATQVAPKSIVGGVEVAQDALGTVVGVANTTRAQVQPLVAVSNHAHRVVDGAKATNKVAAAAGTNIGLVDGARLAIETEDGVLGATDRSLANTVGNILLGLTKEAR